MPELHTALDQTFQALADPTRRAVIERLARGPASVTELAQPFDMALPSFMQHLGLLETRGLIRTRKSGRVRTCEIVAKPLDELSHWLADQRALWTKRLDQLDSYLGGIKEGEPQ